MSDTQKTLRNLQKLRTEQAAKTVAEKIAKGSSSAPATPTNTAAAIGTDGELSGLLALTPENIPGSLPQFSPDTFNIQDPLNPADSIPQATQSQFDRGMKIYEGATRALKLIGASQDLTREKFAVIGKQAKAYGAGLAAASEVEKTRGSWLDYLSQRENTSQKAISLDVSQAKTATDRNIAIHSKDELTQKLKQAEIKAEELRLKTIEVQGNLQNFKAQLGSYVEVK